MCDLCGTYEETKPGRARHHRVAENLRRLAERYEALAYGETKPHSEAAGVIALLAKSVLRELVQDWI